MPGSTTLPQAQRPELSDGARLATFLANLRYEVLPAEIVQLAKECVLDTMGVGLSASSRPWTAIVADVAAGSGEPGDVTVWGRGPKVATRLAAMVNGTAAHGIEMDDRCPIPELHVGSMVIPAAVAVTESRGATGRQLITAVVAGYEAAMRVGFAVHLRKGLHGPGHKGIWGTTAAAGSALDLDEQAMRDAFGLAGSLACGITQFSEDPRGTMVKRLHAGVAASNGILAAQLAAGGLTGPTDVIDGAYGYVHTFARDAEAVQYEHLARDLGSWWAITEREVKPYAAWGGSHVALDAIRSIMQATPISSDRIRAVVVACSSRHISQHDIRRPSSLMAAQYSLPFLVALALCRGADSLTDPGVVWTDEVLADPEVRRITDLVELRVDPEMEEIRNREGTYGGARVTVELADGEHREDVVYYSRGTKGNPLSKADLRAKFDTLTRPVLGQTQSDALAEAIDRLEDLDDVRGLTRLTLPRP